MSVTSGLDSLLQLPRDLLLAILEWCTLHDIANVEATCKELFSLCRCREIWVHFLQSLAIHEAPEFAPFEKTGMLTTADIRARVIHAIRLSEFWRTPGKIRIKTIANFDLEQRVLPDGLRFFSRMKPEVVTGGKFVIVENQGRIELLSVSGLKRIWLGPDVETETLYCHSFGSEMQQDGNVLVIAAAYVNYCDGKSFVCVHQICLESLTTKEVSREYITVPFLAPITVRGDLIMIRHPITYIIYICNWRENTAVAMRFRIATMMNTTFLCMTKTHVLLTAHLGAFTLLAIPLFSLSRNMNPIRDGTEPIHQLEIALDAATEANPYPEDKAGLNILRINLSEPRKPITGPWVLTIHSFVPVWRSCHPSRLDEEIYVVGFEKEGNISSADRLLSWRLRLSPSPISSSQSRKISNEKYDENDKYQLTPISKARIRASSLPWNGKTITNAGRMLSLHKGIGSFDLFCDADDSEQSQPQRLLNTDETMDELLDLKDTSYTLEAVDPWSGILAIRSPDCVKVLRFDV